DSVGFAGSGLPQSMDGQAHWSSIILRSLNSKRIFFVVDDPVRREDRLVSSRWNPQSNGVGSDDAVAEVHRFNLASGFAYDRVWNDRDGVILSANARRDDRRALERLHPDRAGKGAELVEGDNSARPAQRAQSSCYSVWFLTLVPSCRRAADRVCVRLAG